MNLPPGKFQDSPLKNQRHLDLYRLYYSLVIDCSYISLLTTVTAREIDTVPD